MGLLGAIVVAAVTSSPRLRVSLLALALADRALPILRHSLGLLRLRAEASVALGHALGEWLLGLGSGRIAGHFSCCCVLFCGLLLLLVL